MIGVKVIDYFGAELVEVIQYFDFGGERCMEAWTADDDGECCMIVMLSHCKIVDESREW